MAEASLRWMKHHSMLRSELGDGIIIGASSLSHYDANMESLSSGGPLPPEVVAAFDEASKVCKPVWPDYSRGYSGQSLAAQK